MVANTQMWHPIPVDADGEFPDSQIEAYVQTGGRKLPQQPIVPRDAAHRSYIEVTSKPNRSYIEVTSKPYRSYIEVVSILDRSHIETYPQLHRSYIEA